MQSNIAISAPRTQARSASARWPAFAAFSLGLIVLYVVGFSPVMRVHNSAHDTRHSNGFPCH
jgi:cobalt transporter subunit CbtB